MTVIESYSAWEMARHRSLVVGEAEVDRETGAIVRIGDDKEYNGGETMGDKPILTLSIIQPWSWLIVNGYKDVENRTWPTKVRGIIQVHAGKKFDAEGYEWVRRSFPSIDMPIPQDFERGGIVGQVLITGCVEEMDSPWFSGPFGFTMAAGRPLPFVPMRGKLGFFR